MEGKIWDDGTSVSESIPDLILVAMESILQA